MDIGHLPVGRDTGYYGALCHLPDAVESRGAILEHPYADLVKVEICKLTVGIGAEIYSAISGKGEDIHNLGVIGMVNPVCVGSLVHDIVVDDIGIIALKLTHDRRIDMAVEDTRDIVAIVNCYETAADGVPVTVLEQYLLARMVFHRPEIHGKVRPVDCQALQGHAMHRLVVRHLDCRGILHDFACVVEPLLGIIKLYTLDFAGALHRDERMLGIGNDKQ